MRIVLLQHTCSLFSHNEIEIEKPCRLGDWYLGRLYDNDTPLFKYLQVVKIMRLFLRCAFRTSPLEEFISTRIEDCGLRGEEDNLGYLKFFVLIDCFLWVMLL